MGPALLGAAGRCLECLDDVLVRLHRSGPEMPGSMVGGVLIGGKRLRERAVYAPPLALGRRRVDRGANQGMPEHDPPAAHRQQARALGLVECLRPEPEQLTRTGDHRDALEVVRGRHEQQLLRRLGQPASPLQEDALDLARQRQRLRQRLLARELRSGQGAGHFEQGEGVAAGLLDETRTDCRGGGDPLASRK